MIEACETVAAFIDRRDQRDLDGDRMLLFAVVRALEIVGEAASRMSAEMRAEYSDIPWQAMVGMRNRLVHAYFDIDTAIVWNAATVEAPALLVALRSLDLAADHRGEPPTKSDIES